MIGKPSALWHPLTVMEAGVLAQGDGLLKEGAVLALTRNEAAGYKLDIVVIFTKYFIEN